MKESISRDERILLVLASIVLFHLWVTPLFKSLWLDETLIVWTIRHGFGGIVQNSFLSLQSILFCFVERALSVPVISQELGLRIPSVLAALLTAWVFFRIGCEIADRETGLLFAALFVSLPQVAFEVPNARPYSLALFFHSLAALWLLRWFRSGRLRDGLISVASGVVAVHFHHLFIIALPITMLVALWRFGPRRLETIRRISICALFGFVLWLPALPQALVFARQRQLLSFAESPTWLSLFLALTPFFLLASAVLTALADILSGRRPRWVPMPIQPGALVWAATMLILPAILFFAVSSLTTTRLFLPRYIFMVIPGLILVWGWFLRGLEPVRFRRTVIIASLVTSSIWTSGFSLVPNYRREDWRTAVRTAPTEGAILLYSGLIESQNLDVLEKAQSKDYLSGPLLAYRPAAPLESIFLVPFGFGAKEQAYMKAQLAVQVKRYDRLTVLSRVSFYHPKWKEWLETELSRNGFSGKRDEVLGKISLRTFERRDLAVSAVRIGKP